MICPKEWEHQDADLQTFLALEPTTRMLILRLLDAPTDRDFAALAAHPNGAMLASWLLEQPAYRDAYEKEVM
ncbi:hypothetical protein [Tsukamurella tyrosinosolvens]|uniref:hypothetical protein n=1 Tax=Tsukamurella tyrosinosolvens TaxID=57704 RepID=UPI003F49CDE0